MSVEHSLRIAAAGFLPLLLISIAVSACNAQGQGDKGNKSSPGNGTVTSPATQVSNAQANDDITASRQNAITRAIQRVSPAVVGINVTEVREVQYRDPFGDMFDDPFFNQFFQNRPRSQRYKQELHGLGSGFLISADGYIVTNDHVAGRASKVIVTMTDGREYDAKIIGSDPTSDIALLKIEGSNLPFINLGNSDEVIVGEWAIALGNPFGLFEINSKPTVTVGVISNTGVNLAPQDNRIYRGMLQTDAAISSGNSGGPLVNALGQVVGVNATIFSTAQGRGGAGSIGIGFAIPINRVHGIVDDLKKDGSIDRDFWTGLRVQQLDANIARYLKMTTTEGVVIVELAQNSPASRAGMEIGDVLVSINGSPIRNEEDAVFYFTDARVGDKLNIRILRDSKEIEKTMTLTRRGA
jgi:serine protease Do